MLRCTYPTRLWCPPSVVWCSVRERLTGSSRSCLRKSASFRTPGTWYGTLQSAMKKKTPVRLAGVVQALDRSLYSCRLSVYVCIFRPRRKETQWPYWRNNWRRGRNSWQQNKRTLLRRRTASENSPRLDAQVSLWLIKPQMVPDSCHDTLSGLQPCWQPYQTQNCWMDENLSTIEAKSGTWPEGCSREKSHVT